MGSGLSLHSETNYYTDSLDELLDNDRTAVDTGFSLGSGNAEVFEQDIQLRFERGPASGVIGLFYLDSEYTLISTSRIGSSATVPGLPAGFGLLIAGGSTVKNDNIAIFGEVDLEADRILECLSFTLGTRYDREDVSVRSSSTVNLGPAIPLPPGTLPDPMDTLVDTSFDAFLPKLGATYEWPPRLKTSITRGGPSYSTSLQPC